MCRLHQGGPASTKVHQGGPPRTKGARPGSRWGCNGGEGTGRWMTCTEARLPPLQSCAISEGSRGSRSRKASRCRQRTGRCVMRPQGGGRRCLGVGRGHRGCGHLGLPQWLQVAPGRSNCHALGRCTQQPHPRSMCIMRRLHKHTQLAPRLRPATQQPARLQRGHQRNQPIPARVHRTGALRPFVDAHDRVCRASCKHLGSHLCVVQSQVPARVTAYESVHVHTAKGREVRRER